MVSGIAWQVQVRMLARGISKEDMCHMLGVNKRKLYLSLTGRQEFNLDLVSKIAQVLQCKIEDLLEAVPPKYL